jgi:adenosine kinase
MKILVSGSLAYDRIMDFPGRFSDHILPDKIHILNVCFTVNGLTEKFGGTAGNIAYTLSLLGEKAMILSSAGKDFDTYANWLKENGLSLEGIRRVEAVFTAGAYITTDQSDNQITGFNPGAMAFPCGVEVGEIKETIGIAIVSPGNTDDMAQLSRRYRELSIPYICDPGQQIPILPPEQLKEMISGSSILMSNDYELEMIQKAVGMDTEGLLKRTGAIVTTLGEKGSVVTTKDGVSKVSAVPAKAVLDPTGAGDAFRAGFIFGFVRKKSLPDCASLGATAASFAVEKVGTQEHRFTLGEFQERHQSFFTVESA